MGEGRTFALVWGAVVGLLESKSLSVMSALDDYSYTIERATVLCKEAGGRPVYRANSPRGKKDLRLMYEFPDGSQLKLYANGYSCSAKKLSYRPLKKCCWLNPRA